jgi:hypothetical protein
VGSWFLNLPFSKLGEEAYCALFKVTQNGCTIAGCNEDTWGVNACIRIGNGGPGEDRTVFTDFNGLPLPSGPFRDPVRLGQLVFL